MSFLDNLPVYSGRAADAIIEASLCCDFEKVNLYSSLLATAEDTTLSNDIRLNALTALINAADLLREAAGPILLRSITYGSTIAYTGLHNDLDGLNDGTTYLHVTSGQISYWNSKADSSGVSFALLQGSPSDNELLQAALDAKQNLLPNGVGFIKVNGTAVSVDTNTYLTSVTGAAGGDLTGNYPNPTITSTTILSKVLTGFNPSATAGSITSSSTILSALEKLNANINAVSASAGTVTSVSLTLPTSVFSAAVGPYTTTAALSLSFISQTQGRVFAAPSGSNGTPSFRALAATDFPVVGSVTPGTYSLSTVTVDAYGRVTGIASGSVVGTGTVTSVGISPPAQFSAGSAVTTAGNLSFAWASNATPNLVFATPASAGGVPTFRALTSADIPDIAISQVTNLSNVLDGYLPDALAGNMLFIGKTGSDVPVNAIVSGDLTAIYVDNSGTNEAQFTIANEAVTYAKIQNVTSQTLLGRFALTDGVMQQLTLSASDFTINSSTGEIGLVTPNSPILTTKGDLLTYTGAAQTRLGIGANATLFMADATAATGNKWVAMSGDATIATSGAITIANNAVTLAKMATVTGPTIFGNHNSGSGLSVLAMTGTQAATILPTFSTTNTDKGLVIGSNGVGATYYLDATGNWSVPAGGGGGGGTVNSGTQYQLAYYALTGTAVSGLTLITAARALVSDANGLPVASTVSTTQIQYLASASGTTGTTSTNLVFSTSPTLVTPTLGVATATSINKVAITAPATSATLTIADGKTLTASNTLTFTGTDSSSVAFGAGGTVAYTGLANSWASGIKQTFAPSATTAGINVGSLAGQPSSPANGDLVYNSSATALQAYVNGAWVSLGSGGGSGTVNSGTQYQLAYYANTGTAVSGLTTGTSGQVLALSAGLIPTWTTLSTSTTLTNLGAATATASLTNANSVITWNWNSNTTANAFVLGSTGLTSGSLFTLSHTTSALTGNLASFTSTGITSGNLLNLAISGSTAVSADNLLITNSSTANTSGRGLDISITGATASGNTFGASISNTKTGATSTNTALSLTASGGTTNYALDVTAGIVRMAASTASLPHMLFTAGAAALTATTNGMLSYATVSSNSSFYLYKDSAVTTILTTARNPDFATGAQGVVVADSSGNFTKSADLTALGVYSSYADVTNSTTTITSLISGSIVGSTTLPANFFAVGKTLRVLIVGTITCANGDDSTITLSIGASTQTFTVTDLPASTGQGFVMELFYVCRTAGASSSVSVTGSFTINNTNPQSAHVYIFPTNTIAGFNSASSQVFNIQNTWAQSGSTVVVQTNTAYYLN